MKKRSYPFVSNLTVIKKNHIRDSIAIYVYYLLN